MSEGPSLQDLMARLIDSHEAQRQQNERLTRAFELLAAREGASTLVPREQLLDMAERFVGEDELRAQRHVKPEEVLWRFQRDRRAPLTTEQAYEGQTTWLGQDANEALASPIWKRFWQLFCYLRPILGFRRENIYVLDAHGRPSPQGFIERPEELIDLVSVYTADYRGAWPRLCVEIRTCGPDFLYDSAEPCSLVFADMQFVAEQMRAKVDRCVVRQPMASGIRFEVFSQIGGCSLRPGVTGKEIVTSPTHAAQWVQASKSYIYPTAPDRDGIIRYRLDDPGLLREDGLAAQYPEQDARAVYHMLQGNPQQGDLVAPIPARRRRGDPYTGSI